MIQSQLSHCIRIMKVLSIRHVNTKVLSRRTRDESGALMKVPLVP